MLEESIIFLCFIVAGITIGFLFDVFRIFRKVIKTHEIIVYIQDILFFICSGMIMLVVCYFTNKGELRGYMFLGSVLGISLYFLILSKIIIKIFATILQFMIKLLTQIIKFITLIFKIIFKPIIIIIRRGSQYVKNKKSVKSQET